MNRGWKIGIAALWLALPLVWARYLSAWDRLPARLATHFNAAGQPNGWMSRASALIFPLGLLTLLLLLFTAILGRVREPNAGSWGVMGLFYTVVAVVVKGADDVLRYNLDGRPLQVGQILLILLVGGGTAVAVFLSSKRGANLSPATVLAQEVHAGRVWALVAAIPLVMELAILVGSPNNSVRLVMALAAVPPLLVGALAWDGFHYRFSFSGVEISTLGFRLRSLPVEQIRSYSAARWNALRGDGIRGIADRRAYVWGDSGVRIQTSDGELFLGHNEPERIIKDLDLITHVRV
jgi:Protein of unknown function (DUF1648)